MRAVLFLVSDSFYTGQFPVEQVMCLDDGETHMLCAIRLTKPDNTNRVNVKQAVDWLDGASSESWYLRRAYENKARQELRGVSQFKAL